MENKYLQILMILYLGYLTFNTWFSKYYFSDEYRKRVEKNNPFQKSWFLGKTHLWLSRFVSLILFLYYTYMFLFR